MRQSKLSASVWFAGAKLLLGLSMALIGFQCRAASYYWVVLAVYAGLAAFLWWRLHRDPAEELDLGFCHGLLLAAELSASLYLTTLEQNSDDPALLFFLTATFAGFLYRFWGALPVALAYVVGLGLFSLFQGLGVMDAPALRFSDAVLLTRWGFTSIIGFSLAILTGSLASSLRNHRIALIGSSQALELARLDMNAVVNSIASGVLVFDDQLKLLYSNQQAASCFPSSPIYPGKSLEELVAGEAWGDGVVEGCHLVLQGAGSWNLEASGRHQEVLLFQASGHWARGKLRILVLTLQDITSLRRMEADVRSAERMATLGSVAAQLVHEIRNPLASISGSAQLLEDIPALSDDDRRLLSLIRGESGRLNRILQEFLDFSRLKPPSFRPVDLRALLENVRLFLMGRPEGRTTPPPRIQLECPPLLMVRTDSDLLLQILQNLSLNGLQAVPSGKKAELKLIARSVRSGSTEIIVSDNGIGMKQSVLDHAGEVFFTTKEHGNGLGLAVCKQLAASLGGELLLDSTPDKGTKARLVLKPVIEGMS